MAVEKRRVRLIAHRGGSLEAPENTLHAFRRAVELGCDAVELDLRATVDGQIVVAHDPAVDRTTDGSGPVEAMTLAELKALDAAHWFVPGRGPDPDAEAYPLRGTGRDDLRVATLAEVLRELPDVPLIMDLKVGPPAAPWVPEAVAGLLADHGREASVIVGSFDQERLDAFRIAAPGVPTSATQEEVARFWGGDPPPDVAGFTAFQVPPDFAGLDVVTAEFVTRAHRAGAQVHVWTVDDPEAMRRLVDLGVDGIITDVPTLAREVLAPRRPAGADAADGAATAG